MTGPVVDVVIAVHSASRPIQRAVASVLEGTRTAVRVTVVCHNMGAEPILANLGSLGGDDRVRLLEFEDGIPSPAGPFNFGLDSATAPFTAMLDSDDTLEPGAIDSWVAIQRRDDSDAVIQRFVFADGTSTRTPPARPFRRTGLDGRRDRLSYRTRQHGLVSRSRFGDIRLTPGLRTGEDVEQGLRIWFSGARLSFDRSGPAYVIHIDENDRTSASAKSVTEDFAFLDTVLHADWFTALSSADRASIVVKLLRIHLLEAAESRSALGAISVEDAAALSRVAERLLVIAPNAHHVLGRRDARIIDHLRSGREPERVRHELTLRRQYWRLGNLVSGRAVLSLHREAPLRFLAALATTP